MFSINIFQRAANLSMFFLLFAILLLSGCTSLNMAANDEKKGSPSSTDLLPANQPYYPTDFKDLLIPAELSWDRTDSMTIKTSTYSGGVLSFSGRLEVNSLTDFFLNSMVKSGWQLTGSVKSKDILLAFIKPKSTCLIRIFESSYGRKTSVTAYITKSLE